MNNKIKILLIIVIATVGALLIYYHFDNEPKEENNINKFSTEYTLLEQDNVFTYVSIDDAIKTLSSESGIVFFCTPESIWCQNYALYLNQAAKENGITEIKYLDIKEYRQLNTIKYEKIVELLDSYIYQDDLNNKKIFMPDLSFVKNGNIVAHDNETSLVQSDVKIEDYWTNDKINEFKNKIREYVLLMNENDTEISKEVN